MIHQFFFLFDMRRLASNVTGTASTDMRAAAPVLRPLFLFSLLFSAFWLMVFLQTTDVWLRIQYTTRRMIGGSHSYAYDKSHGAE